MLKNYFLTAFRNLLRQSGTTIINLSGLTIGITCSIILFLIVDYHKSFDTYHSRKDRIYRIVRSAEQNNGRDYQPGVPSVLPDAFRLDFPEAEEVIFTAYRSDALILIPQQNGPSKKFEEENGVVYTEPGFFRMFDRTVLRGEGAAGLDQPNEAVISKGLAQKYFGKDDVLGEVVRFANADFKIAGVVEDAPSTTDLPFNLLLSYVTVEQELESQGWGSIWSDEQCYFLLREGESIANVNARFPAFLKKHDPEVSDRNVELIAQPLAELHFDDRYDTYNYSTASHTMLNAFVVIAIILLLTACINFINLSTAEAIKRSKEVGIRKTLGGTKPQLIVQFLGETTLLTVVAVVLSLSLSQVALGLLNPFLGLELQLNLTENYNLVLFLVAVTLGVSLFSGLYPAFVVSGFRPALALKNKINNRGSSGYFLRSTLVVVQFFISQFFIIGTIVLIKQMDYFQKKDLGFTKDAVLIVPIPEGGFENREQSRIKARTLRDEMSRISGVELASLASAPPSSGNVSKTPVRVEGDAKEYITQVKNADDRYVELYDLNLIAGKNIHDLDSSDGFIVNETFAKTLGFQNVPDILGKSVTIGRRHHSVVGIVKDFHTSGLENAIEPTVLYNNSYGYRTLSLKVDLSKMEEVTKALKSRWEAAYPDQLFAYEFLDESIRQFYEGERKMATLLTIFTCLAIVIGCLGLFGLATFMANQRRKEIGIRKVLGASVESIVLLFSREYARLILIGFLLAAPLAAFAMQKFLDAFAYKIELGPGIFILGLLITLAVAMITVGVRSIKAAIVNPVNSLRYE